MGKIGKSRIFKVVNVVSCHGCYSPNHSFNAVVKEVKCIHHMGLGKARMGEWSRVAAARLAVQTSVIAGVKEKVIWYWISRYLVLCACAPVVIQSFGALASSCLLIVLPSS